MGVTKAVIELGPLDVGELRMFVDYFYEKRHQHGELKNTSYVKPGYTREAWIKRCDMVGFAAEMAFARYLRVPYELQADTKLAGAYDVAGYEVRGTDLANGCLITRDFDKPAIYVLGIVDRVDYLNYHVTLAGWANYADTLKPEHHRPSDWYRANAYYTPQTELHPLGTLPTITTKATVSNGI
jgi:hypothetical protein